MRSPEQGGTKSDAQQQEVCQKTKLVTRITKAYFEAIQKSFGKTALFAQNLTPEKSDDAIREERNEYTVTGSLRKEQIWCFRKLIGDVAVATRV